MDSTINNLANFIVDVNTFLEKKIRGSGETIRNSQLPTPHSPVPTPHSPFPTPHSPFPTPHSPLPTPHYELRTVAVLTCQAAKNRVL
ncbi:MAG: hypothetical protein KME64_43590 [Scytonematopsis contorta HA4267-MV1]|nr:hypothetical protein [Scytonematopsis contorta HA4267-MV1]